MGQPLWEEDLLLSRDPRAFFVRRVGGTSRCPRCQGWAPFDRRRDAMFCEPCDRWLELACLDRTCEFCTGRPLRPLGRMQKEWDRAELHRFLMKRSRNARRRG